MYLKKIQTTLFKLLYQTSLKKKKKKKKKEEVGKLRKTPEMRNLTFMDCGFSSDFQVLIATWLVR